VNSRIASDERIFFKDRLQAALRKAHVPNRASTVAREFNLRADGATVTTHAVRKWLSGESIPTHERLLILAGWLGVHASWLLYGDAENSDFGKAPPTTALRTQELILIGDFNRLSPEGQTVLRGVLDVLIETMGSETSSVKQERSK
jgi:transcriptional regulator with XRE-family HTH domain